MATFNGYQLNRVGTLYASSNVKWFEFYTRKNCIAVKCITYARYFFLYTNKTTFGKNK